LEEDVKKEGKKYELEAMELIRSLGERSAWDILYGVWPERCATCWDTFFMQLDPSEWNVEMEWMQEMIKLTRRTMDSALERKAGNPDLLRLQAFSQSHYTTELQACYYFSQSHYTTELQAIYYLSVCFVLISENEAERWLAIFVKRVEEIETAVGGEGWDLGPVQKAKLNLIQQKCRLYDRQGKVELALELIREAMEKEKEKDPKNHLDYLNAEFSLKTGQIEEAFQSMEKFLSGVRSNKAVSAGTFKYFLTFVPVESQSLFVALVPKYPHVLWAASSSGFAKLSEEQNKMLRSHLVVKKGLYCVNCSKELTKVYRCSRCEIATYCGTTCQKDAWKEHKKICKKREEKE
jgi:hypothetical protein